MKKPILLLMAAAMLSTACDELFGGGTDPVEELPDLNITASVSAWGTETSLEKNDQVGLYASAPFNLSNFLFTVGDAQELIASQELKWKADSTVTSVTFIAYTPYSSSYSGEYFSFSAQADQRSQADIKASDLMMAKAEVQPLAKSVKLSFSHKMVRIGLYFDNRTGKEISDVTFENVGLGTMVDIQACSVYEDSLVTRPTRVSLASYTAAGGAPYFAAIIAPQAVRLSGRVTFADGSSQAILLSQLQSFASGQQWDNQNSPIVLEAEKPQDVPAEFEVSISDWAGGDSLQFIR